MHESVHTIIAEYGRHQIYRVIYTMIKHCFALCIKHQAMRVYSANFVPSVLHQFHPLQFIWIHFLSKIEFDVKLGIYEFNTQN